MGGRDDAHGQAPPSGLPAEALAYYDRGREEGRLSWGAGLLERARTEELLARFLPPAPAVVYDVGGGAGVYACSLAGRAYAVHLIDAAPLHVEQARTASAAQPDAPLAGVGVGDARRLPWLEASGDAVLLLGPPYHLTERADRLTALREARRVLRPGGVVCAAAISRWASALDGLVRGFLDDPEFVAIVERDLADGQHRNPSNRPGYFTTVFFHRPEELRAEVEAAGLRLEALVGIEGPGGLLADLEARWADERRRAQALQVARWLEAEPALLGLSAHLLAIARREG